MSHQPIPNTTSSITHAISGTAVKTPPSSPIAPPLRDPNPPPSPNPERRTSIATSARVITRGHSREKPISNATWQPGTHSTTRPGRNCPPAHGKTVSARAQMGFRGETRCCSIRTRCMVGGYDDRVGGLGAVCV